MDLTFLFVTYAFAVLIVSILLCFPRWLCGKKKKKKKMKPLMVEHVLGVQMWKRSELTEGLVPGYRGRGF